MKKSTSKKIFSALVCVGILLMMCMNAFAADLKDVVVNTTPEGDVTVTGKIDGNAQVESTILVTTGAELEDVQDTDIAYIDQVTTAADGNFSYTFKVDNTQPEFKLYLGGTNVAQVYEKPFTLTPIEGDKYVISGTVKLLAATEEAAAGLKVVAKKDGAEVEGVVTVADGNVAFSVEVEELGTYKLVFERQGYLKKVETVEVTETGAELKDVKLLAGDIKGDGTTEGDGRIDSSDLVGIIAVYDTQEGDDAYNANYDIDGDKMIGSTELVQIVYNYDSVDDVE